MFFRKFDSSDQPRWYVLWEKVFTFNQNPVWPSPENRLGSWWVKWNGLRWPKGCLPHPRCTCYRGFAVPCILSSKCGTFLWQLVAWMAEVFHQGICWMVFFMSSRRCNCPMTHEITVDVTTSPQNREDDQAFRYCWGFLFIFYLFLFIKDLMKNNKVLVKVGTQKSLMATMITRQIELFWSCKEQRWSREACNNRNDWG